MALVSAIWLAMPCEMRSAKRIRCELSETRSTTSWLRSRARGLREERNCDGAVDAPGNLLVHIVADERDVHRGRRRGQVVHDHAAHIQHVRGDALLGFGGEVPRQLQRRTVNPRALQL